MRRPPARRPSSSIACQSPPLPHHVIKTSVLKKDQKPISYPGFAGGLEAAFNLLQLIGKGAFGTVYKAINITSGEVVALKKMKMKKNTLPSEILHLSHCQSLPHPNVIQLKDFGLCINHDEGAYIAMEFAVTDLRSYMHHVRKVGAVIGERGARHIMQQLLRGIAHVHSIGLVHRDIKPENTLLNSKERVKICDFGLATAASSPTTALPFGHARCTERDPRFGTLQYCAPELLLEDVNDYSAAIDIWSAGCIMGELLLQKPLFDGEDVDDQIDQILGLVGTYEEREQRLCLLKSRLSETYWSSRCRNIYELQTRPFERLREVFPSSKLSEAGLCLLARMLHPNPQQRITAEEALKQPWFYTIKQAIPIPDCISIV